MKRLVICFDGTWNSADSERAETNVALIARAIRANPDGGSPQLVLYLRGVGSTGMALQQIVDGAFGKGVDENIRSGYMFLAQNYVPGDQIFLFGFSRGAFTARSLSGFISCCGLLKRQSLGDLTSAWTYYRGGGARSPADFCRQNGSDCHEHVSIDFLGVWDTVGALGVPTTILGSLTSQKYAFHDTEPSKSVKRAFHALAVDEHRDEFAPTLWTGKIPEGATIEQVWFAGAHSDVGGGYRNRRLADIPLVWMAEKAREVGLSFDDTMLPKIDDDAHLSPHHESRQGWSLKDRLTPTYRRVCGEPFDVKPNERLYYPVGDDGNDLPTINEYLHPSLIERYRKEAHFLAEDEEDEGHTQIYEPKNLRPLLRDA